MVVVVTVDVLPRCCGGRGPGLTRGAHDVRGRGHARGCGHGRCFGCGRMGGDGVCVPCVGMNMAVPSGRGVVASPDMGSSVAVIPNYSGFGGGLGGGGGSIERKRNKETEAKREREKERKRAKKEQCFFALRKNCLL